MLGRRLAAQHLGRPAGSVAAAVRDALAVQAQDPPLAQFSLGLRTGLDAAAVRRGLTAVVRTHVLRPTWHYVHRDDLRWLVALTGPKIISGMASRHRTLGIDDAVRAASRDALRETLRDGPRTRDQLASLLPVTAFPRQGDVVGHLLLLAEAEGLVCSGPLDADAHAYALVDDVVPEAEGPTDPAAALVERFVAGHGPTAVKDLQRWCTLTLTQIRQGLAAADLERGEVAGVELWWRPDLEPAPIDGAWLLPTFDEAFLSHAAPRFPRRDGHPFAAAHINPAAAGGGVIIVDGVDVGTFKRTWRGERLHVTLRLAAAATRREAARAEDAVAALGDFLGREPEIGVEQPA